MRIFFLIIGSLLISISLFLIILYLNLFTLGYTFLEFVYFIIRSCAFWFLILGGLFIYKGLRRMVK